MKPYYFGVAFGDDAGHHLYGSDGFWPKRPEKETLPFSLDRLDQGFCPHARTQGVVKLTWESGWTILAFWDQTGDSRPGSHSTYLLPGTLKYEDAVTAAKGFFPLLWKRATDVFILEPMCCSVCRGPTGYEMEDIYEFVCDGCAL